MEGEITPVLLRAAIDDESPISCCLFEGGGATAGSSSSKAAAARDRFEEEKDRILRDLQQMINRYNECFHRLRRASADVDALRRENLDLVAEKLHLTFLVDDREASAAAAAAAAGAKRKETKKSAIGGDDPDPGASDGGERNGGTRGGIPKSISIRSRGFLATAAAAAAAVGGRGGGGEASWRPQRLRVPAVLPRDVRKPLISATFHMAQEGGEEAEGEEEEVEVEVYSQGMEKTELCNKWGEPGGCPYAARCRFAHGMEELRPVLRHPRYKTQLCRMLGNGGECPYGHRCHFRHALPNPQP
uniref:C3H1-type domain-containing protein n=1 Tax=Ananas comosus var. bracteatus TaxID=296719 RepID=A0A6V7PR34_ANACO|nr:unnamed protein product [Ananas comosus var. bracteatus]